MLLGYASNYGELVKVQDAKIVQLMVIFDKVSGLAGCDPIG